jgi:SprT-like family
MISPRSLYDAYNTRYWADRLPPYAIRRKRLPGLHGQCDRRRRIIWLDLRKIPDGEALRRTLLHEMCHAADRDHSGHGASFQAQLAALAQRGEAWAEEEQRRYSYPYAIKVNFPTLRTYLEDWLMSVAHPEEISWRVARTQVAHSHGISVRDLDRDFPRLRASWRQLQRQAVRERRRDHEDAKLWEAESRRP